MSKPCEYRPDIDGLRAVAVTLVLLFHAKFSTWSGGFVGVDIFFVISGFLITNIIYKEQTSGQFSFSSFYTRRFKRIVPVLTVMIMVCIIPAYFILFTDDFENFSRTLIHSFISTNNFYLWQSTSGYFSDNTDLMPLLHTWSLAVEEQFYIIWPALLIVLLAKLKESYVVKLVGLLLLPLLALSEYMAINAASAAYFLLPARAFELLIGGWLALNYKQLPQLNNHLRQLLAVIGAFLIVLPAFLLNKGQAFPGINALWPCLGTAILIYCGRDQSQLPFINKLLSVKPIVLLGLISYSLYLWHWPVLVFTQYMGLEMSGIVRIVCLAIIVFISYLSWRFIETPTRRWRFDSLKAINLKFMLPSFLLVATAYGVIDTYDGFPARFENLSELNKKQNYPSRVRKHCFDAHKVGNVEQCWLGEQKEHLDGMLIGDSFANHSVAFLHELAKRANLHIHDSAAGGYPLLTQKLADGSYKYNNQYGEQRWEFALEHKLVFLAADWDRYSEPENINYVEILRAIEQLTELEKRIFIVTSVPDITKVQLHQAKVVKSGRPIYFEPELTTPQRDRSASHIIEVIKSRFPSVTLIEMETAICERGQCPLILDDKIIYRNRDHLNISGARSIAERYLEKYGNPLLKPE
ncbi:MAG: acyltransferase [Gammaproteobacteria bacterium]|nr:acyltransferase [Gammaproteobacteria bacterium]